MNSLSRILEIEQIQKAPVMQFITDTVGNLGSDTADLSTVGSASCLRVRVAPFGHQKSEELTSDTVGCACVAVLMAMPEEFRLKVGALDP